MSYFFRRLFHLAKANPYHDEIGRFTTAENAVMFVRPRSGYHDGQATPDQKWRGAYPEGERFGIRRVRNHLGDWVDQPTPPPPGVVELGGGTMPAPASFQQRVTEVARQMASMGPAELGAYPQMPDAATRAEIQRQGELSRSDIHPDYHPVIDKVTAFRDRAKSLLSGLSVDDIAHNDAMENALRSNGYSLEMLGDKGINATYVATDDATGEKFFIKLNRGDYGHQPEGGAIEEERSYALLVQAGFGQSINPMFKVHQDVTVQAYFENAGKLSSWMQRSPKQVRDALRTHGQEIGNLGVAEYLLGDMDKHRSNYNFYNGRVYGTDWSRSGNYDQFRAGAFNAMGSARVKLDPQQLIDAAERMYKAIDASGKLFGDLKPNYKHAGVPTRRDAARERLDKLKSVLQPYIKRGEQVEADSMIPLMGWDRY